MSYDKLPEHMQEGARAYVEQGYPVGGFLRAVLENNLVESFATADFINTAAMHEWANWAYNECPLEARGSQQAVTAWIASGGLEGRG